MRLCRGRTLTLRWWLKYIVCACTESINIPIAIKGNCLLHPFSASEALHIFNVPAQCEHRVKEFISETARCDRDKNGRDPVNVISKVSMSDSPL
jgi:hypothetical protein